MTNKQNGQFNGGKLYGDIIKKISPKLNKFVQEKIKQENLPQELESILLELPKKRESKNIMRPSLTYLIYRMHQGQDSLEQISPLLAVSELNNYYCYLDNWILDGKNGIANDIPKIGKITIASQMLRDLTQKLIEEAPIAEDKKRRISKRLAETTMKCYEGQFKDLKMTLDTLPEYKSDEEYLNAYLRKSKLQSGFLYGLSGEIGAVLANAREKEIQTSRELLEILGTGLQISNDLGDFAVASEKNESFKIYQDQLADIINGRLTFPSYYVLKNGTEEEKETLKNIIGKKDATEEEKLKVSKVIFNSGAYKATREILNSYYHQFKRLVKQMPETKERCALSSVGEIIRYNKYLAEFKKFR